MNKLKKISLSVSILIFLLSLTQPAFYIGRSDPDGWSNSLGLLLMGWSGALFGGAGLSWLAHPFLLLSWIFFLKKPKMSLLFNFIAIIFSASFLLFHTIISDEAGNYSVITERKTGYWLWLTSIIMLFIFNLVLLYLERINDNRKFIDPGINTRL